MAAFLFKKNSDPSTSIITLKSKQQRNAFINKF